MAHKDIKTKTFKELGDLHYKTGFHSPEIDKTVHDIGSTNDVGKINTVRFEMWLDYTEALLFELDSMLDYLLENMCEIEDVHKKFNGLVREFSKLSKEYEEGEKQDLPELIKLFERVATARTEIKDTEKNLLFKGRIRGIKLAFACGAVLNVAYVTYLVQAIPKELIAVTPKNILLLLLGSISILVLSYVGIRIILGVLVMMPSKKKYS